MLPISASPFQTHEFQSANYIIGLLCTRHPRPPDVRLRNSTLWELVTQVCQRIHVGILSENNEFRVTFPNNMRSVLYQQD